MLEFVLENKVYFIIIYLFILVAFLYLNYKFWNCPYFKEEDHE